MSTVTLLVVVVIVVVVVAVLAVAASVMLRKRRSERLREEFGPEYERTLQESDDPNAAEADLRRREKQRNKVQLRALDERERTEYRDRWDGIQREFVDDPGRAVEQADRLVVDVMSARGYPAEDVDRRADDLSVDYPVITQRYREAREISRSHEAGRADTEDLRGAVTSYRELVHALLDDSDARDSGNDRDRGGALPRGDRDDRRDGPDSRDERPRDADRARDDVGDRDRDRDRVGDRNDRRDGDRDRVNDRDDRRDGDRDRVNDRDGDRDRVDDRDGDHDRDGRRVRDVVKDKVTGRDSGRGPDSRGAGDTNGQAWERGRHAFRSEDDPRRETTT